MHVFLFLSLSDGLQFLCRSILIYPYLCRRVCIFGGCIHGCSAHYFSSSDIYCEVTQFAHFFSLYEENKRFIKKQLKCTRCSEKLLKAY